MNSLRSFSLLLIFLIASSTSCRRSNQSRVLVDREAKSATDANTTANLDIGPAGISSEPLEANNPGDTEFQFQSLSPSSTGIDFVNPIDQSHPSKYLYASAVACGGVAIGDVDSDGWPDILLTSGPLSLIHISEPTRPY